MHLQCKAFPDLAYTIYEATSIARFSQNISSAFNKHNFPTSEMPLLVLENVFVSNFR